MAAGLASKGDRRWSVYPTRRTGEAICSHFRAGELELMVQRLLWYHGEPSLDYSSLLDVCIGSTALDALLKFIWSQKMCWFLYLLKKRAEERLGFERPSDNPALKTVECQRLDELAKRLQEQQLCSGNHMPMRELLTSTLRLRGTV